MKKSSDHPYAFAPQESSGARVRHSRHHRKKGELYDV